MGADYGKIELHNNCTGCPCQHKEKGKYIGRL